MTGHPAYAELRQLVAELSLISHAPIGAYGKQTPDSGEDIGGKRPPGADGEFKPRRPKGLRVVGNASSEKAWDEYEEDLAAWDACYQRRTPEYFRRQLERCTSEARLLALRDEVRETLEAWRRMRIPAGQPPTIDDPQWKRWVGESSKETGELARLFNVPRQHIQRVRKAYRAA